MKRLTLIWLRKRYPVLLITDQLVNYGPYLIYMLIMSKTGATASSILPFAIFYALRKVSIVVLGDFRHHLFELGIGSISLTIIGCLFGIFANHDFLLTLSAIGTGIGAGCYPLVNSQFIKIKKHDQNRAGKSSSMVRILFTTLTLLLLIAGAAYLSFSLAFILLAVVALVSSLSFISLYRHRLLPMPIHLHLNTFFLGILLLLALIYIRVGKSELVEKTLQIGLILLAIFLAYLILTAKRNFHLTPNSGLLQFELIMYGSCVMFWLLFTIVFYGNFMMGMTLLVYIAAMTLAKPITQFIYRNVALTPLHINLFGISLGLLLTFNFYTYLIGIFFIRVFGSAQKSISISTYEALSRNYQTSTIISYYLNLLGGLIIQFIFWGALIIFTNSKEWKFILSGHQSSLNLPLMETHMVLVGTMLIILALTYYYSRLTEKKSSM